jgi:hypothetical protein
MSLVMFPRTLEIFGADELHRFVKIFSNACFGVTANDRVSSIDGMSFHEIFLYISPT